MLKKEYRLRRRKDFKVVYNAGRVVSGRYVVMYIRENRRSENRWGFVVSKKVGGAVTRNLVKRRLREMTRKIQEKVKPGFDLVVIARVSCKEADFRAVMNDLEQVCRKAKITGKTLNGHSFEDKKWEK